MSHSSIPIQELNQPLLPVPDPTELQVLLPISVNDWNQSSNSNPINVSRTHSMKTRLQNGAIERKDYVAFYTSLLELQFLNLDDSSLCYDGFSFVAEIVDPKKSKSFRVASTNPNWQHAM